MVPLLATLVCFALYLAGYHIYAKYLGRRIFQLDSQTYLHNYHHYYPHHLIVHFYQLLDNKMLKKCHQLKCS